MKMNKKGFTLIELLAVIVILAIIALIAVPQVLKILNNARRSSADDSAYGILKAAESYVATYMMEYQGDWPLNSNDYAIFDCTSTGCTLSQASITKLTPSGETLKDELKTLDFKGTKPTSGQVQIDTNGIASIVSTNKLVINGFTCTSQTDKTVKCEKTTTTTTTSAAAGA